MQKTAVITLTILILAITQAGSAAAFGVTAKDDPFASGRWFLGASSGLDFGMGTDIVEPEDGGKTETDVLQFGLGIYGGYFVLKGWELGPTVRYDYGSTTDENDNVTTTGSYLAGLQTGYYYAMPVPFHPFFNIEMGYAGRSIVLDPEKGDSTSDIAGGFAVRPSLGAAFFFTDKIALTPSFYFQHTALYGTDDTSGSEYNYDAASSRFGFQVGLIGIF